MKQYLKFLLRPGITVLTMSLVIGTGYSIVQYHLASADADPVPMSVICGSRPLSQDLNYNGCGISSVPPGPVYSNLVIDVFAIIVAILVVFSVIFASKKYFAKFDKKPTSRKLLHATTFGVVLFLAAAVLVPGYVNSAWNGNWVSELSGEMLTVLAFIPSLAVLTACFAKARQNSRRNLWIVHLLLIAVTAYFTFYSVLRITAP